MIRLSVVVIGVLLASPALAASCVHPDEFGALFATTDPISECSGYVLMDASEFSQYPTLSQIFARPDAAELAEVWGLGAALPLFAYLVAWAFGSVINFFNPEHERS